MFRRSTRSVAWGFVAGSVLGYALGLLLAPQEGRKTQRRIVYQLEHLAGQVAVLADNLLKPSEHGEARRSGDALVADARERAQRIQDDIDRLLTEMRRPVPPSTQAGR